MCRTKDRARSDCRWLSQQVSADRNPPFRWGLGGAAAGHSLTTAASRGCGARKRQSPILSFVGQVPRLQEQFGAHATTQDLVSLSKEENIYGISPPRSIDSSAAQPKRGLHINEITGGASPAAQGRGLSPDEPPAHTKCGVEAPGGFEPPHRSFADCSLSHLGTAPLEG